MDAAGKVEFGTAIKAQVAVREHAKLEYWDECDVYLAGHADFLLPWLRRRRQQSIGNDVRPKTLVLAAFNLRKILQPLSGGGGALVVLPGDARDIGRIGNDNVTGVGRIRCLN